MDRSTFRSSRHVWCVLMPLSLMLSASCAPSEEAPQPQPSEPAAEDNQEVRRAEIADDRPPVEMAVTVVGTPGGNWQLLVRGKVAMPAPRGALALRAIRSTATPPSGLSTAAWARSLPLDSGATFSQTFDISGGAEGDTLEVTFLHEELPYYHLESTYEVVIERDEHGALVARAEMSPGPRGPDEEEPPVLPVRSTGEVSVMGTATLSGSISFNRYDGASWRCRECRFEAFDADFGASPDDYITAGYTDRNGNFTVSFGTFADEDGSRPDVYFKVYTNTSKFKVIDNNSKVYWATSPVVVWDQQDVSQAVSVSLPTTGNVAKAFWIYREGVTSFWAMNDGGLGADGAVARYPVDTYCDWEGFYHCHDADAAHYHAGGEIHLGSNQYKGSVTYHEHGHFLMYKAYNNYFPWTWSCNPHMIHNPSSQSCAWAEGWADFWALEVPNNPTYYWSNGSWTNLDNWTCSWGGCGGNTGNTVEGRVAGALWDLRDSGSDGWDHGIAESRARLVTAFRDGAITNQDAYSKYRNAWLAKGYPRTSFDYTAGQNTISFVSGVPLGRWVSIRALANSEFVCADNAGANPLIANRWAVGGWEKYYVWNLGNGLVALQSSANSRWVTAENGGASALIANRTSVGPWETFRWIDRGNGDFALQAQANGKYVTAENGGASALIANRTSIGPWETFHWDNP